jgi:hypothetical protein
MSAKKKAATGVNPDAEVLYSDDSATMSQDGRLTIINGTVVPLWDAVEDAVGRTISSLKKYEDRIEFDLNTNFVGATHKLIVFTNGTVRVIKK